MRYINTSLISTTLGTKRISGFHKITKLNSKLRTQSSKYISVDKKKSLMKSEVRQYHGDANRKTAVFN